MYREEINFVKLLLKQFEIVLEHLTLVTLTYDPVTPKSIWLPRMDVLIKYKESWLTVLAHLTTVTLTFDPGYRQTDLPACAKQYAILSSKGGIIISK